MRLSSLALAALLLAPVAHAQSDASTTIILVRHAEKGAEPTADPLLTDAGAARANALAAMLKHAGVSAIYSTELQRTRLTGAPAAAALGLTAQVIGARVPAKATADSILKMHRGKTVLIVGHSNTVPALVAAFGAAQPPEICDPSYDNLFVVTVPAAGAASVVRLRFGAETPACTPASGAMKD